jgi:hypothetical protein
MARVGFYLGSWGVMETRCVMRWRPKRLQTEVGPIRKDGDAMGLAGVQRMWWIVAWSGLTGPGMLGPKSEVWARETGRVDQNNVMRWKPGQLQTEVGMGCY